MNRTVTFIVAAVLAALGIIGTAAILGLAPEQTEAVTGFIVQLLGLAVVAAVTIYGLGKTNEKLEQVEHQTSGNLSRRDAEIERLTAENIELARQLATRHGP